MIEMTAEIKERSLEVFNSRVYAKCYPCPDFPTVEYSLEIEAEPVFDVIRLRFNSRDDMIELLENYIKVIKKAEFKRLPECTSGTSAWDGKYAWEARQLEESIDKIVDNCREMEIYASALKEYLQSIDGDHIHPEIKRHLDVIAEDADQIATKNHSILKKIKRTASFIPKEEDYR